jgi:alpha-mannosidase
MRLDSLFTEVNRSLLYPLKLVSLSARRPDATGWTLSYRSAYHPGLGTSLQELSSRSAGLGTQHLIVSTHQDIAWMDSPEQCIRDRDEKIITPLLHIMKEDPAYRFDLEDVLCLREYLVRHPERKEEIHRYLREGRLGVGASFNQPYEDLCSGEMLVRQFYAGRRWLRTNFPGCDTKTYWNPDVPGRTLQMAQVMHKAGVEYLVMSRFERLCWFSLDGSASPRLVGATPT